MIMKKQATPKIQQQTSDYIPITDYTDFGAFSLRNGGYLDLLQIVCKDLNSIKDYDLEFDIMGFSGLYKTYADDIKIITMNYPVNVRSQISYCKNLQERSENPACIADLDDEVEKLEYAHENFHEREFYLMFFSKNAETYRQNLTRIKTYIGRSGCVAEMELNKKIQILRKIANMNMNIAVDREPDYIPQGIPKGMKFNPWLLYQIQPQGNMSFQDPRITKKGDGYEACIHVYDYKDRVGFNWLSEVTLYEDTIATVDISTANRHEAIRNINRSMSEQMSRYYDARNRVEQINAETIHGQLEAVYREMQSMGEVIKVTSVRIYVFSRTQAELEKRLGEIIDELENQGYHAAVFLDENEYEWRSLFLPFKEQKKMYNHRNGRSIPSESVAAGHPFHFSSLDDPCGYYFGMTKTAGAVRLDRYQKDRNRLSYSGVVVGNMRSGKSTLLKRCIKLDVISGNFVRGYATNDEFNPLINYYGGTSINLDGSDGFLNLLQVYRTSETETASFMKHIAKVSTFYRFLVPECTTYDIAELEQLVKRLYKIHMGYDENSDAQITGLPPEQYPILSDLLRIVQEELYSDPEKKKVKKDLSEEHFKRVENIELVLSNLISVYGHIFDGHSSIRDFSNEQLVFFNVANLKQYGDNIFDAQLYNSFSLLWDNLIAVGAGQKEQFDRGQLQTPDARKFMIYMDEAHNFINARKLTAVTTLNEYMRESPKFFGGIVFASQRITDFIPEGSASAGIDAIKNLFSLAQYKYLFRQGSESYNVLRDAFRGELPESDLEALPTFDQGECVLIISGLQSLRFKVDVTPQELELFAGGA